MKQRAKSNHTGVLVALADSGWGGVYGVASDEANCLHRLYKAGLAPGDALVLPQAWVERALANGAIKLDAVGRYSLAFADDFVAHLGLPLHWSRLMIQPLDVPLPRAAPQTMTKGDYAAIGQALAGAWTAQHQHALTGSQKVRLHVLLTPVAAGMQSGLALLQSGYATDLACVDGQADTTITVARIVSKAARTGGQLAQRLQQLFAGVRRCLGEGEWALRWADDGKQCTVMHLSQWRTGDALPLQRQPDVYVPVLAEALPPAPAHLSLDLLNEAARALTLPNARSITGIGRVLLQCSSSGLEINHSLLADWLALNGLPAQWLKQWFKNAEVPEAGAAQRPIWPTKRLLLAARRQANSISVTTTLTNNTTPPPERLEAIVQTYRQLLETQLNGLVAEWLLRCIISASNPKQSEAPAQQWALTAYAKPYAQDLTELQALALPHRTALAQQQLPADAAFKKRWIRFYRRYGHRGTNVLDLSVPRLREQPDDLLDLLATAQPAASGASAKTDSESTSLLPLQWLAPRWARQRVLQLDTALQALEQHRHWLLKIAEQLVRQHQLPTPEAIWQLDLTALRALLAKPNATETSTTQRNYRLHAMRERVSDN